MTRTSETVSKREGRRSSKAERKRRGEREREKVPMVGNVHGRVPITAELTTNPAKITSPGQEESRLNRNTREQNELTEWGPIS